MKTAKEFLREAYGNLIQVDEPHLVKTMERYSEERLKEWKDKEILADRMIVDLEHEKDVLKARVRELEDWRKSQLAVWGPVIDYFQEHGERHGLRIGQSISKFILDHFETKL